MKTFLLAAATLAAALPATAADPPPWAPEHGRRAHDAARLYDGAGRYLAPRPLGYSDSVWRGRDGRYYCRRENGTTGLIVGAAVGALLGRELDRGGLRCR